MTIKLICIDMDGTLLSSHHQVSEENKLAIKQAVEKGVHVAITTGRLHSCAKLYAEQINLKTPVISSNGAYIADSNGEEIYKNALTREDLKDFGLAMEQTNMYWFGATKDHVFSTQPLLETDVYLQFNKTVPKEQQVKHNVYTSADEIFNVHENEILAIQCSEDEDIEKLAEVKAELKTKNPNLEIVSSWFNNFEVLKKGSSKGDAVKVLTNYFDLTPDNVMCIGDSENDLSMLTYAGVSVAMGNASEQIKSVVTYITDTNDNNGVAKAIEKFVLSE